MKKHNLFGNNGRDKIFHKFVYVCYPKKITVIYKNRQRYYKI